MTVFRRIKNDCHLRRALLTMVTAACLVVLSVSPAMASPTADSSDTTTGTVSFATDTSLTATLAVGSASATITLPSGMSASSLTATLTLDSLYAATEVRITAGGTTIATVDATSATSQHVTNVVIPDSATQIADDGTSTIEIGMVYDESTVSTTDLGCRIMPPGLTATLSDISFGLAGSATEISTVAQFMSGPAEQIFVVSGSDSAGERTAALSAVASAAHVWSDASVELVSSLPSTVSAAYPGAVRVIAIDGSSSSAASTQSVSENADGLPTLTLAGSALSSAAAALGDARVGVADSSSTSDLGISSTATASATSSTSASGATEISLTDLGLGTELLSGFGTSSAYVSVPQAVFGGPVSAVTVQLTGTHSALPSQIVATANVYWNNQLVDSFTLGSDTAVDRTIEIQETQMQAQNSLRISLSATTAEGTACSSDLRELPVELSLDTEASTLSATRGESLEAGFARFPQALGGTLAVAFDSAWDTDTSLALAGQIVADMQQAQLDQLEITEVSTFDALNSNNPVLIVGASSDTANQLSAPLRLANFRTLSSTESTLGATVDQAYATLEAFESGGRDVLLAGGWAPDGSDSSELASSLASWMGDLEWGWNSLNNDVVLAGPNGVTDISSGEIVPQSEAIADYKPVAWWALGGVAVLAVLVIAGILGRRRRVQRAAETYVASEESDHSGDGASAAAPDSSEPAFTVPDSDQTEPPSHTP